MEYSVDGGVLGQGFCLKFLLCEADGRYWQRVFWGLRSKRHVPRTGFGVAPVVGNLGGGNRGTDGVGRAVLAFDNAFACTGRSILKHHTVRSRLLDTYVQNL